MAEIRTEQYKQEARTALGDRVLQNALSNFQNRIGKATLAAYGNLPEGPAARRMAHDIRMHAIENLDVLLWVQVPVRPLHRVHVLGELDRPGIHVVRM